MTNSPLVWISEAGTADAAERNIGTLGLPFLQAVLNNMAGDGSVAFGQTGTGQRPNYQIVRASGEQRAFRGDNHRPLPPSEQFSAQHLSASFAYSQLLQHFCQLRDGQTRQRPQRLIK